MMDPEERERRRRYVEDMRDLVRDMDASSSMPRAMPEPSATQSFGDMPLLSSARSERFRAEAEEWQRKCEQERERREQEERRILREQQRAAERAARSVSTEEWTDAIGEALAEERLQMRDHVAEQIGLLRAELTVQRAAERGQFIDLPALPIRRRSSDAA